MDSGLDCADMRHKRTAGNAGLKLGEADSRKLSVASRTFPTLQLHLQKSTFSLSYMRIVQVVERGVLVLTTCASKDQHFHSGVRPREEATARGAAPDRQEQAAREELLGQGVHTNRNSHGGEEG
eukprot:3467366-Amphidinium_carterae.1